jgi:hypothetical protein
MRTFVLCWLRSCASAQNERTEVFNVMGCSIANLKKEYAKGKEMAEYLSRKDDE